MLAKKEPEVDTSGSSYDTPDFLIYKGQWSKGEELTYDEAAAYLTDLRLLRLGWIPRHHQSYPFDA